MIKLIKPHLPYTNSMPVRSPLELLSPAKNLESGIEAINHGADAVYIGGPAFGARSAAGNSLDDIARLAEYAHRFHARVYVTMNTLLYDDELDAAHRQAWALHHAGADALIVQDMGLLELDLPPIALHASTQTDNRTPEKVSFLEKAGFSQVVLARELTLEDIRNIAAQTTVALEFFIHGALCVSYSGQCYISHAQTGRSANRGECAQLCRLPYAVEDASGQTLARNQHLLSLKDMNQSANLSELIDAGITSFKIEGRLKDLGYVKNVTAHYRRELDRILDARPELGRASHGRCHFAFEPQPTKSFNRGATDYFLHGRQPDITSFRTPKFTGEAIGKVTDVKRDRLTIDGSTEIHNGDGLCFFDRNDQLIGFRVNRAEGAQLIPGDMPEGLEAGTILFRNGDLAFDKQLEKPTATRRIAVDMTLRDTAKGFELTLVDEAGIHASAQIELAHEPARQPEQAFDTMRVQLAKLGNTRFAARDIRLELDQACFIAASTLNGLRREAIEALEQTRQAAWQRPERKAPASGDFPFPAKDLSYLGNVANRLARDFYQKHGVEHIADAYECNREAGPVSLMITKHCLRYSLGQCPKEVKGKSQGPLTLVGDNQQRWRLRFDCKRCEMHVIGQLRPQHKARKPE
jgi:putative protease